MFTVNFPCNRITRNGHIYPVETMREALKAIEEQILNKSFFVFYMDQEADDYETAIYGLPMDKVAGVVEKYTIDIKDYVVKFSFEVLDTPYGRIFEEEFKQKPVYVAPFGVGRLNDDGKIDNYAIMGLSILKFPAADYYQVEIKNE